MNSIKQQMKKNVVIIIDPKKCTDYVKKFNTHRSIL